MAALVAAIDQGTSSSRVLVFDAKGAVVAVSQVELPIRAPQSGWADQDPQQILATVHTCLDDACQQLERKGYSPQQDVKGAPSSMP